MAGEQTSTDRMEEGTKQMSKDQMFASVRAGVHTSGGGVEGYDDVDDAAG